MYVYIYICCLHIYILYINNANNDNDKVQQLFDPDTSTLTYVIGCRSSGDRKGWDDTVGNIFRAGTKVMHDNTKVNT